MDALPDDVVVSILSELAISDVMSCACVNRRLNACSKHAAIWQRIASRHLPSLKGTLAGNVVRGHALNSHHNLQRVAHHHPSSTLLFKAHATVVACCAPFAPTTPATSASLPPSPVPTTLVATGSADSMVRVWDLAALCCVAELAEHSGTVQCVRWVSDGLVVSGGWDKRVCLWDIADAVAARGDRVRRPDLAASDDMDTTPATVISASLASHRNIHRRAVMCIEVHQLEPNTLLVLSGGGDRRVVAWAVDPAHERQRHQQEARLHRDHDHGHDEGEQLIDDPQTNPPSSASSSTTHAVLSHGAIVHAVKVVPHSAVRHRVRTDGGERAGVVTQVGVVAAVDAGALVLLQLTIDGTNKPVAFEQLGVFSALSEPPARALLDAQLQDRTLFVLTQGTAKCEVVAFEMDWENIRRRLEMQAREGKAVNNSNNNGNHEGEGNDPESAQQRAPVWALDAVPALSSHVLEQPRPHARQLAQVGGLGDGYVLSMVSSQMAHLGTGGTDAFRLLRSPAGFLPPVGSSNECLHNSDLNSIWPRVSSLACVCDKVIVGCTWGQVMVCDYFGSGPPHPDEAIPSPVAADESRFPIGPQWLFALVALVLAVAFAVLGTSEGAFHWMHGVALLLVVAVAWRQHKRTTIPQPQRVGIA